jgi:hypothetical protein
MESGDNQVAGWQITFRLRWAVGGLDASAVMLDTTSWEATGDVRL